jgi:hypothetical protein
VILTSDVDWNQRLLDFDIDDDDDWYDASSDNMNHSELVDAFGDYKGRAAEVEVSSANTWFDTVTPDQYTRVQLEEATIVCSEHAYRVHHFDNTYPMTCTRVHLSTYGNIVTWHMTYPH